MYATATERNQIVILIVNCTCMYFYVQWCVYIQILWNPLIVVTKKDSWISLVPFIHEFETQRVIEQFISALIELLDPQNYVSINLWKSNGSRNFVPAKFDEYLIEYIASMST